MTNFLILLLLSLFLFFEVETLIYNSPKNFLIILFKNPLAFIYNLFIIFSLLVLMLSIKINILLAFIILFIIFLTLSIINYQLKFYRNEYLKPIDIKLFKESAEISKNLSLKIPYLLIPILLLNIFLLLTPIFNAYSKSNYVGYVICLSIFICICILLQNKKYSSKLLKIKVDEYSDFNDFKNNGFLLTFIMNLKTLLISKPRKYEKNIEEKILKNVEHSIPNEKPNIIVIMNESFFDINTVKGIKLSENPLPNFLNISNKFTNGNVISPVLGGGTCQPEYEMLTGNSVFFTYKFKIAFLEFFKNTTRIKDGLCSTLKNLSYSSLFIHPYNKDFYNRTTVYTSLGFEKILDIKHFQNPKCPRNFISDKNCYSKVIDEFENRDKSKPFFSVVVTMQNHPGYIGGKNYNEHNIKVLNKNISKNEKIMLENYANLLKESDIAIKYLTDYFDKTENTVILFFGDHQPSENIGFASICKRSTLELSRTPFFIWDNFNLDKINYNDISPCFLSPILLNSINNKSNKYFNYLFKKLDILKAFNTGFVIDNKNQYINRKNSTQEILKVLEELELIQFDRIYNDN